MFPREGSVGTGARRVPGGIAAPPLEDTYWTLVHLADVPVAASDDHRVPYVRLDSQTHSAEGYGGCNRFFGAYELRGDRIAFGTIGSTMMFCDGRMETEQGFLSALARTVEWEISGSVLSLSDSEHQVVARLEARHVE